MKIMLINELRIGGGSEVQSLRERDLLRSMGHQVVYLTFDPSFPQKLEGLDLNIPVRCNFLSLLVNRIRKSKRIGIQITSIIESFNPDIIHINNIVAIAATVYDCVEPYPCFQTIRDYGAVCPKGTCVHDDYSACNGYKQDNCLSCIGFDIKYQVKNVCLRILNRKRLRSIDRFICPSSALSVCCTKNGISTKTVNNPFDFSIVVKQRPCFSKIFLYYGALNKQKGIIALLQAWSVFANCAPDARLMLVGKVAEGFMPTLVKYLNKAPTAEYLGCMSNSEIMTLYQNVYCVVVPSLWIENYPNTVLEALANKTLVIGSDRGGIPELIQSNKYLFDVLDCRSIVSALVRAYEMDEPSYIEETERAFDRCSSRNSLKTYYDRIMALCGALLDGRRSAFK